MRTAKEWGRVAVSLPGWRWLAGMSWGFVDDRKGIRVCDTHSNHFRIRVDDGVVSGTHTGNGAVTLVSRDGRVSSGAVPWPHPDDPATAGCLLALLEPAGPRPYRRPGGLWVVATGPGFALEPDSLQPMTLGRACIAAAEALGRWPGGEE